MGLGQKSTTVKDFARSEFINCYRWKSVSTFGECPGRWNTDFPFASGCKLCRTIGNHNWCRGIYVDNTIKEVCKHPFFSTV
jgi:hypothetical protein